MKKKNYSLSITIPAYNEEETIEAVVKEALNETKKLLNNFEILLINDGSIDNTGKIINNLSKKYKNVKVIHHKENKGFTGAMKSCFKNATKQLVFLAPADGQFDFKELKKFIKQIEGNDVILGYRTYNEESSIRKLNSRLFHLLCRISFGIKFKEISTISLWKKDVLDSHIIEANDRSALILPELIYKSIKKNYVFLEVPIHWHTRKGGKPKGASINVIVSTLLEMLKLLFHLKKISLAIK